jgi:soluble lytic murein transglycosylase
MARVPTYDRFQATPNTLPQAFAQTPNLHPELAGRQAQEIGQGLTNAGDAMGKIAQDMMVETNQTRLDDASLQLREAARKLQFGQHTQSGQQDPGTPVGYAQLKGKDALDRPNGQPLSEEYGSLLQDHVSKIADSLGNDAQKAAFAHYAGGFTNGFKDNIWQHAFAEQRTYNVSVADGLKTEAIENLKNNYRNPGAAEEAIATVLQQTNRIGKLKGLSVPEIDASTKKEVSGALQVGVNAFLAEGDPEGAHNFYNQFSQHMTMDDALPVKAKITAAGDNKIGLAHGQAAFTQAIPSAPGECVF